MMGEDAALVGTDLDDMDWDACCIIGEGSAEAHGAELSTVRAAVDLPGGGEQREGEADVE